MVRKLTQNWSENDPPKRQKVDPSGLPKVDPRGLPKVDPRGLPKVDPRVLLIKFNSLLLVFNLFVI